MCPRMAAHSSTPVSREVRPSVYGHWETTQNDQKPAYATQDLLTSYIILGHYWSEHKSFQNHTIL